EVPFPSGRPSAAEVLALFARLTTLYRKDGPMDAITRVPESPPAPAVQPPRRRWRAGAALAGAAPAGAVPAPLAPAWLLTPPPPPPRAPPPRDVRGNAWLGRDRLPIPGMLTEQSLNVGLSRPDQPEARLLWQLLRPGEREPVHAGDLPIGTTAATLASEVLPK